VIAGLYRRPGASTTPAAVFVEVDPLDPLTGAVPTWRIDEEPLYLECVRDLGVPGRVEVPVEVEVVEVSESSRLDEDVACRCTIVSPRTLHEPDAWEQAEDCPVHPLDDVPTRALVLVQPLEVAFDGAVRVRSVEDEPVTTPCPDCSAAGLDPCRPKSNPAGRPLTRWHRRRRLLERDAGSTRGDLVLLVLVVVVVLAVAGGVGRFLSGVVEDVVPCVAATASGLGATECAP